MLWANFYVNNYSYNSTWQVPMDAAITQWNGTSTPANITKTSASLNTVLVAQYSGTWYGTYTPDGQPAKRTFVIRLNSRTIARDATHTNHWIRSTFSHELGHALSLLDNPNTASDSLMKHSRDRANVFTPRPYDRADVNAFY